MRQCEVLDVIKTMDGPFTVAEVYIHFKKYKNDTIFARSITLRRLYRLEVWGEIRRVGKRGKAILWERVEHP